MAMPTLADVRAHVRNVHDETLAWQRQQGLSQIPSQHSHDQEEANLGKRLAKLLIRRTKALGTKPSGSILTQAEATLINNLQGVPSQGCAVSINLLSEQRETLSSGAGHPALTSMAIGEASAQHSAASENGGPHTAAPSDRVDEVENSSSGGPHSAASCKLPSSVFVAASGKRNAADAIKQPRAQSMKRPRQMDPSSGDLHPAAESGANLAVEEAHSEKPAGLNTESSGVPQPAASCHEPRSPMVFMKILEPIWAAEVADGQKMFECVANKTKWQNQFKQLSSGDLFIVVLKGRDKVNAVCEVASPAIVKETNRDVLKSKLQESRHAALDAYLDGAESFDYVEFKHVFDCRCFLSVSSTAAFLDHVGLALPKSPLVGLLRPVVLDEQWHSRLHEYMQQAVLRLPVSLATASHKAQITASNVEGHVDKPAALAKMSRDVSEVASSGSAHSAASTEVLWLVLEESRYDAIASGRLRWEARPRDGTVREINNHLRDPYFDWKLARPGRSVVLQRGMGTGTYRKHAKTLAVKIAQVRIFSSAHQMLKSGEVVVAADLVPNCTDPIKFYEDLYGGAACANAFVAMRLELPKEAPAASQEQSSGDVHPAGIMSSERSSCEAATATNNQSNSKNISDPHPTVQSSGEPHPTARVATNNQVSHGNTPYQTFDARGRVRWGERECADKEGCGRVFCETCYPL